MAILNLNYERPGPILCTYRATLLLNTPEKDVIIMSKIASLTLHSSGQLHQGTERLTNGVGAFITFLTGNALVKAVLQWNASAQLRRRANQELAAFWEQANHDPRIMGDYLAAQARGDAAQESGAAVVASPIVMQLDSRKPFAGRA
jgi:hypothetical protein